ncbi:hypothetical protein INT45_012094 [Circinella minor]|uniref:Uncharacterized protein n=1 Tax=Circinella minor TaxID=1195481 RepID=A0A8H7RLR6_9FUNG|nr:hypothetical protein INT45_012094 [Circinella minor]
MPLNDPKRSEGAHLAERSEAERVTRLLKKRSMKAVLPMFLHTYQYTNKDLFFRFSVFSARQSPTVIPLQQQPQQPPTTPRLHPHNNNNNHQHHHHPVDL